MNHRTISLDILRQAVVEASTDSSMRSLAVTIGVGRTTLQNFVRRNQQPHPRTRRRVAEWYVGQREPQPGAIDEFEAAIRVLLRDLVPRHVPAASTAILTLVETLHRVTGSPLPPAVETFRRTMEAATGPGEPDG